MTESAGVEGRGAVTSPFYARGVGLHRTGQVSAALDDYLRALANQPDHPEILLAIAAVLHDLERYVDALTVYRRLQAMGVDCRRLHHNLGNTLLALDHYQEAIESYGRAIVLDPDDVEAMVTMGTAIEQLGKYRQALLCYEEALRRRPDSAEAHWNLALGLLRFGEYERGWEEFAWRWRKKGYTTELRQFAAPIWQGEPLTGKRILVHAEQALGDTLQFARYLQMVASSGGELYFECPAPLVPLLATLPFVRQVFAAGERLPVVDFQLPLLSLPGLFRTTLDTIPAKFPYLTPPRERVSRWQEELGPAGNSRRIGLVWAGRRRPDPHRSCSLAELAPLARLTGVSYYSLQVGAGAEQAATPPSGMELIDLTGKIADFADTAALVAGLDLVITIDTSVAHLAGGMGKPTFLLLPAAADWRWKLDRKDSPWYPSMVLFRQRILGDWSLPVSEVAAELESWLRADRN